ncbi:MAG: alpha-galactosidase [Planctomycetes bacterium]|nr:alpha-galactosidase [Planctomycetota bacterium]
MPVSFDDRAKLFHLSTRNTSYVFYVDNSLRLFHLYYGAALRDAFPLTGQQPDFWPASFSPVVNGEELSRSPDYRLQELAGFNQGDFRPAGVVLQTANGAVAADLHYFGHRVIPGKPRLEGLPSAFAAEGEAETVEITLRDKAAAVEVILAYTVFPACDVIVRSARAVNTGSAPVVLERLLSAQLDFDEADFDVVHLQGSWARERHPVRNRQIPGGQQLRSVRGATGHHQNPAVALCRPDTSEEAGDAWGLVLAYSGDYLVDVDTGQYGTTRVSAGINPETFSWTIEPGAAFTAPEVYLTFSACGLGRMSRNFHRFLRSHVISPRWAFKQRPILINNWEATYFDFNAQKIIDIARSGAELGIEMLVLDDGWFGKRDDDRSSLGDWVAYSRKIGDIGDLVRGVNHAGMKFGLWFEPEMVSPDSDLCRAHPDWVLQIPGRGRCLGRNQYVLDFSRDEVVDHVFKMIAKILHSADIVYMKWDFNRNLTEVFSPSLLPARQGKVRHRFVLGVYRLYRMLLAEFPDLLIEGCSGGGGRFDAGILAYSPQIWCSDDTDAMERLAIQTGTSLFYPPSSMGAHVSVCPNHMTGRTVPFATRGYVALAGTFGYELDLTKMSPEDRATAKEQIALYHRWHDLVECGDYYRLLPERLEDVEKARLVAWSFVAPDRRRATVTFVCRSQLVHAPDPKVFLRGLDPERLYKVNYGKFAYELVGGLLMSAGLRVRDCNRDGAAAFITLES